MLSLFKHVSRTYDGKNGKQGIQKLAIVQNHLKNQDETQTCFEIGLSAGYRTENLCTCVKKNAPNV